MGVFLDENNHEHCSLIWIKRAVKHPDFTKDELKGDFAVFELWKNKFCIFIYFDRFCLFIS